MLPVGTEAGARRWPYHGAHDDCWGKPWKGVVLASDDPRAWRGTIAFPGELGDPPAEKVRAHVAWCHEQGLLSDVPVAWEFGKVYWERWADGPDSYGVRPYGEDLVNWQRALWNARLAVRRAA